MKTNRLKPLQKNLATMIKYAPLQYLTRHATNPVCRVKTPESWTYCELYLRLLVFNIHL